MKKIYSFAFAAVAILSAASCQKEELTNNETLLGGGNFTVTATTEADTKTVLVDDEEGNTIYWTPGDKITLFDVENKTVSFATDIKANATTAIFTNEAEFSVPDALLAIYPAKADAAFDGTTISKLRIAGSQTAVAGSFDPAFAVAVGTENNSGNLYFKNINSLIKFTIGGEKAPATVTFTNGGWRNIAGLFTYNTSDGVITPDVDAGAKSITLKPAAGEVFEVGKTYYIAFVPGGNLAKISLKFDDTEVKYIEGPKYADESNDFFIGKIINFGTVSFPTEDPEPVEKLEATLVRAIQSQGTTSYMTTLGGTANTDRNMTMDGEYIYIAETQASPVLWKISIADGTAVKMPVGTVNGGGTFALACPRIIKNTDANINGGKDVLAVCNMGQNESVYLYIYTNGLEADPIKISMHHEGLGKRLGDQFSVSGSLQSGYAWFKEQGSKAVMLNQLAINSENIAGFVTNGVWPDRIMLENGYTGRGSVYFYPGADWSNALYTTTDGSGYVTRNESVLTINKPTYQNNADYTADYTGCHGFNFFKHNDKDYIAYTSFNTQTLYIIEGASSAAGVKSALNAKRVVFEAKIAAEGNSCVSGNSGADCMVYTKNGKTYVAGHIQNVGVVVYELK